MELFHGVELDAVDPLGEGTDPSRPRLLDSIALEAASLNRTTSSMIPSMANFPLPSGYFAAGKDLTNSDGLRALLNELYVLAAAGANDVTSVFGRIGAVVAAASDYDDVQVDNTSTVVGTFVKDALDTLDAGKAEQTVDMIAGAGLTGGGTLAATRTFNVIANGDASIVVNAGDIQVGVLATDGQHGVRGGGTQHANVVGAGAAGFMTGSDKTKLDTFGVETTYTLVDGSRAFSAVVGGITPTIGAHLATKDYVDALALGIEWQDSILDRDLTAPPGSPSTGDRYIVDTGGSGAWSGHDLEITEWDGAAWQFTVPSVGMVVGVDDELRNIRCSSLGPIVWGFFGTTVDHGTLAGIADDDHSQYHTDGRAVTWLATQAAGGGLGGNYPNPTVNGMTAGVLTDDTAHGVRGGGTQHADVIAGGADGFMTGADKTKLDAIGALANVTSVFTRTGVVAAAASDYTDAQVDNTSTVVGTFVKDALDTLDSDISTHLADAANPHGTDIDNLGTGTIAELNAAVTDATLDTNSASRPPNGVASGALGGNYPGPTVNGMTSGVLTNDAAHGVRGGGTQHADVIAGGADGFMTGADKTKLDALGVDQVDALYVGKHGNDSNDGKTVAKAYLTIGAAIAAAATLSPASDNEIAVVVTDSGIYAENLSVPSYVHLKAPLAQISDGAGGLALATLASVDIGILTASVGGCMAVAAGTALARIKLLRIAGTQTGIDCNGGFLDAIVDRCVCENGDPFAVNGNPATAGLNLICGSINITGSASALKSSSGPLNAVVGRIDDAGGGVAFECAASANATIHAQVSSIDCNTRWDLGAASQLELTAGYLAAGTETGTGGANVCVAKSGVQTAALTVVYSDFTESSDGVLEEINFAAVLPTNARILGCDILLTTQFTGGVAAAVVADVGLTGEKECLIKDFDALGATASAYYDRGAADGTRKRGNFSGAQLCIGFTPDGGESLDDLTAGELTVTVDYYVPA